ncbi:MAG: Chain length determinant protein tyrosine kinase [Pseudomonadota bacterium]|jgi:Mrp family chromosome partitioning ATPase
MRLRSTSHAIRQSPWTEEGSKAHPQALGQILLELKALNADQVDLVLDEQKKGGQLYGETAIALNLVEPAVIQRALEQQSRFTVLDPADKRIDPRVIAAFDPRDDFAQSIRALRGSLASLRTGEGEPIKTIAIVGIETAPECGIIAANLAVVCAQAGYRTILVDANTDYATHDRLFSVTNRAGVTSLLTNRMSGIETLQMTALPNLAIIAAGPAVPNTAEMFERTLLFHRLHPLLGTHDFIIVDAATHAAEVAGSVCTGADGILIAVKQNHSSTRELQTRIAQFEARGIPIIGTVFTN